MTTNLGDNELLTVREVSAVLRVAVTTVVKWCGTGKLPAAKIGKSYRIRRGDLSRWYEGLL